MYICREYPWEPIISRRVLARTKAFQFDVNIVTYLCVRCCFVGNELFEFNATSGDNLHEEGSPLLRGHAAKELWGLACNPTAPEFCTVGEDKQLRIWDIYSKR